MLVGRELPVEVPHLLDPLETVHDLSYRQAGWINERHPLCRLKEFADDRARGQCDVADAGFHDRVVRVRAIQAGDVSHDLADFDQDGAAVEPGDLSACPYHIPADVDPLPDTVAAFLDHLPKASVVP